MQTQSTQLGRLEGCALNQQTERRANKLEVNDYITLFAIESVARFVTEKLYALRKFNRGHRVFCDSFAQTLHLFIVSA